MASEFDLIKQHFTRTTRHTNLSVGDDAALISVLAGMELAISADMLVAGTHFFHDADPYKLGWKSLAVNLSDMAAMGANPKWTTLAIALPSNDSEWLTQFSAGFFACAETFNVDLIGGDTTHGPLTISVQIMGETPTGSAIQRNGAKVGDDIWISGNLGNAALALAHMQEKLTLSTEDFENCANALHMPQPRVSLGLALLGLATSAIDISDGLLADLGHILERSNVGAKLQLSQIPHSTAFDAKLKESKDNQFILNLLVAGGDDYELCFTAPAEKHAEITKLAQKLNLKLSPIGKITASLGLIVQNLNNEVLAFNKTGFDHFG
jgi:thiamine-monophosphate kinase